MSWTLPIIDRTQEDVNSAKSIRAEKLQNGVDFDDLTSAEKDAVIRGFIYDDTINRIENNQQELKTLLNNAGYWGIPITNKTDWDWETDIFRAEDWRRILQNENILKAAFYVYQDTPQTPNETLYYTNLNAVEKILADLKAMIASMTGYYRECNTFYCGE